MVGFPDFIYKHIVPACFLAPLKPTFDLSDAQTVLVSRWGWGWGVQTASNLLLVVLQTLSECAVTLKMIHLKRVKLVPHTWTRSSDSGSNSFDPRVTCRPAPLTCCPSVLQGPEFLRFLQQDYLPSLHVSPDVSQVRAAPFHE